MEELTNTSTTPVAGGMTKDQAYEATERLKAFGQGYGLDVEALREQVKITREGEAWSVLNYRCWTGYLAATLDSAFNGLTGERRLEVVEVFAKEGMTTRAIAPIVGIKQTAVALDIQELVDQGRMPATRKVQGLNGKTYTVTTEPAEPREPDSLEDQISKEIHQVGKRIQKLDEFTEHDEFTGLVTLIRDMHEDEIQDYIEALGRAVGREAVLI